MRPMPQSYNVTLLIFVAVLFVVGAVFGGLMVHALTLEQQEDLADEVARYIGQFGSNAAAAGDSDAFWSRLLFHGKWLLLVWVLGVTVVGVPLVLALDFLKGALVGFAVGMLVSEHSWKGVLLSLVSVAPPNLITVPAILMASVASLSFSLYVVNNRLLRQRGPLAPQLISFTASTAIMLALLAGAALLETYVSPVLIGWVAPMFASS